MSPAVLYLAVAAVAAGLAIAITPQVRRAALARGYVAGVSNDRWHRRPTAHVGGVAIFLAFSGAVAVGLLLLRPAGVLGLPGVELRPLTALVVAGVLMFATGLLDDLRPLPPAPKLLVQVAAGAILVSGGVMLRLTGFGPVDVFISLSWFVLITNALNLLDNMDGLAGGVAAIAAGFLGVIFVLDGMIPFAMVAFALAGALMGFLRHNVAPARIFMGDCGSLFLGIFLAGLALAPAPGLSRGLFGVVMLPVLILAVPILDTTLVTAGRIADGRPIAVGARDHASHRLVALGLPEAKAVRILWLLAVAGGTLGVLLRTRERAYAYLVGGILMIGLALLGAFLIGVGVRRPVARGGAGLLQRLFAWQRGKPFLSLGIDLALFTAVYYGAYTLRWDDAALTQELSYFSASLPLLIVAKTAAFVAVGVYRIDWRHFALPSAGLLLKGAALGSLLFVAGAVLLLGPGPSRGVVIIDFVFTALFASLARLSFRLFEALSHQLDQTALPTLVVGHGADVPVVFTHLRTSARPRLRPVGFVDIEPGARPGSVMGVSRYVGFAGVEEALSKEGPAAVLFCDRGETDTADALRRRLLGRGVPLYRLSVELEQLALPLVGDEAQPEGPSSSSGVPTPPGH